MKRKIITGILIGISLGLIALGVSYLSKGYIEGQKAQRIKREMLERRRAAWDRLETIVRRKAIQFGPISGVVIEDLSTGWRIAINEGKAIPAASMSKLPIIAAYGRADRSGKVSLDEELTLTAADKTDGSGTLKSKPNGSKYRIRELLELMITESDNTATNMLIKRLGMDYLNGEFASLGLTGSNLARKMMDMKSRRRGIENYTSASDISRLLKLMYQGKLVDREYSQFCIDILAKQKMRDRIPKKLPKDLVIAHKTGLERYVCHDAGICYTPKGNFLITVLTKHHDKAAGRAKAYIADLALLVYNQFYR